MDLEHDVRMIADRLLPKKLEIYASHKVKELPKLIGSLSSLNILEIYNSPAITSSLGNISTLTGLKKLQLHLIQLKDLKPLSSLVGLTDLSLELNLIENVSPLLPLTQLSTLNLKDNCLEDVSDLKGLTSLQVLKLSNNRIKDVSDLNALKNLLILEIAQNPVALTENIENTRAVFQTSVQVYFGYEEWLTGTRPLPEVE